MFLYFFAKSPSGNVECHGAEVEVVPSEIKEVQTGLSEKGYLLSDSSEYMAQMIKGSQNDGSKLSGETSTTE